MTHKERTALVVVDMQQGFFDNSWGATTNHPQCEDNVALLIHAWTEANQPVVIVRHDSLDSTSPLNADHPGNSLMPETAGVDPALMVTKTVNSAFLGTPDLEAWLRAGQITTIVLCGIQTNMCVETTARMGGNLGFDVVVAIDATRTFDLAGPDGTTVDAATLMRTTATNLHGGGFARVASTSVVVAELRKNVRDTRASQ